ncbi:MAG: selenocysteine-specific translation elongation factor [Pseudomonadota bacterium]
MTVAVLGHVDHGKTQLTKALTGTETDTLREEKDRGLTIVPGFAHMDFGAQKLHLIDTPGHADFITSTASGVSGADAILLVVSAVEGPEAQTLEHIRLASLFGIRLALVVLSKSDLRANSDHEATIRQIEDALGSQDITAVETIICSAETGTGLEKLTSALRAMVAAHTSTPRCNGGFLPIDRAFSSPGIGTIVTGTSIGDVLSMDDEVMLSPAGKTSRIRGLQVSGETKSCAGPGARVAINLAGIDASAIRKGDIVSTGGAFSPTRRCDVVLRPSADLKHMGQVMVLHGTAHAPARVRLYHRSGNRSIYAQLEFQKPQVFHPGQRLVLRQPASRVTLTGGPILDPNASLKTRQKTLHIAVLESIATRDVLAMAHTLADRDHGLVDLSAISRCLPQQLAQLGEDFDRIDSEIAIRVKERAGAEAALRDALQKLHASRPARPGFEVSDLKQAQRDLPSPIFDYALNRLLQSDQVTKHADRIALSGYDPVATLSAEHLALFQAAADKLQKMGVRPVPLFAEPDKLQDDLVELLVWTRQAIKLYNHGLKQTLLLSADAVLIAARALARAFPAGQEFTTGAARTALDTNRKTIVPLLEHFDRTGVTVRNGDVRRVTDPSPGR